MTKPDQSAGDAQSLLPASASSSATRISEIGSVVGQIEDETMIAVNRAIVVFYGLA